MTLRASIIIDARDRASAVFGRIAAKARGIGTNLRGVQGGARSADRAIDRLGTNGSRKLERFERIAKRAERAAYGIGRGIGMAARAAGGLALAGGAAGLAASGGLFAKVISTTSQFEQFQIILENTEGSADKARRSMAWVQEFARTTPFELDQVMQAYVALRAYGIDPTNGSLRVLGDTAAGMGRPVMQAVEMMADAMTGEFERLKEFGVRAKVEGDNVTFSYRQNGREMTRTARNSSAAIETALTGILGNRFAGMMDRQSKTLAGIWSNIKDSATGFLLQIGQAGVFDRLKARAEAFLERISGARGSPQVSAWAQRLSDNMGTLVERAFDFVERTDWMAVANGVGAIVGALITVVGWIGRAASAWSSWQRDIERVRLTETVTSGRLFGPSREARAAARQRLDQMNREDAIAAGRTPLYPANQYPIGMRLPRGVAPAPSLIAPGARARGNNRWGVGNPFGSRGSPAANAPWLRSGTNRLTPQRAQPVRVGGRMDLRVSMGPGLESRLTRLESSNRDVPIRASRGPVTVG